MIKARYWVVVCLLVGAALAALPSAEAQNSQNIKSGTPVTLPLVFERNGGQVPSEYGYVARRGGTELLFVRDGVDIFVAEKGSKVAEAKLRVVGGSALASAPQGEDALPGRSNYLRGADATKWVTGVPQFGRLRFAGIYDGVDLEFHGTGDNLENDFLVAPGADARAIRLSANAPVRLNAHGDLEIVVGASVVTLRKPVAYQMMAEQRQDVPVHYSVGKRGEVRFALGTYDHAQPLVIDPVFGFSTYLTGTNNDQINAVTTDAAGSVYVTGSTLSVDFPVAKALQSSCASCSTGSSDAFVSKLDPTGHTLLISTFLGGDRDDSGGNIVIDANSNILVTGTTVSDNFPHAGSVKALTCQTNSQCFFVSSIKPDGSGFNYSGEVGGMVGFYSNSSGVLAVDASGNAYLAGVTDDPNFQITAGTLASSFTGYPTNETFILKLDSTGKLLYSTPVPPTAPPPAASVNNGVFVPYGIAADAQGDVTIGGHGGLGLPTTPGVVMGTLPVPDDQPDPEQGFALKINPTASAIQFATYLPGVDAAFGMTVGPQGNYFFTGVTSQLNLPVSSNAYMKTFPSVATCECGPAFILEMSADATQTLGGTYLGTTSSGSGTSMSSIAIDSKGNVFVGGMTSAKDFPLVNPITTVYEFTGGTATLALAEFSSDFSKLEFGSYLSSTDAAFGGTNFGAMALDANDNLIVVGDATSANYPTTPNSYQPTAPPPPNPQSGSQHAVISKIDMATAAPAVCFASQYVDFGTVNVNTPTPGTLTLTNCGNAALTISSVKSSSPTVTVGAGCATVAVGATCGIPLTFTATDTSSTQGTITLTDNAAVTTQSVTFDGAGGTPQVALPTSIKTADALVGTSVTYFFPLYNYGTAPWILTSVSVTGDFTVTNGCTTPVPGQGSQQNNSCQIGYTFTPTQSGTRTGTLTIVDNQAGSPHAIPISGNGLTSYTVPTVTAVGALPTDTQQTLIYVTGTNFFPASQAIVNGTARTTTYYDEDDMAVALLPSDLTKAGELAVTVSNPFPGGGVSNSYPFTVYGVMRNVTISDSVFDPKSGHIFATVDASSTNSAGKLIEIDPVAISVVNSWSVGNKPHRIAISDDSQFLYVGLDTDHTVAQVALPGGTVNFSATLGLDPIQSGPTNADALRVLPGAPHSWVVTPCATLYTPCRSGVKVFDDSVARATTINDQETQPDSMVFLGSNASTLYGTTLNQGPPALYQMAINASGITLTKTAPANPPFPGGGLLDTDGTLIYVNNGQIIDPSTLAITNTIFGLQPGGGIKVDTADSQIYFVGENVLDYQYPSAITAVGISSLKTSASLGFPEQVGEEGVFRFGTNGIAVVGGTGNFFFETGLTGTAIPVPQITVTGWAPTTVAATAGDVTVAVAGKDFAQGDTATANGTAVTATVTSSSQMSIVIPAAIIGAGGNVNVVITGTQGHTASLVVAVTGSAQPVASVSPKSLTFDAQFVGSTSQAQMVAVTNTGGGTLSIVGATTTGDFAQTNTCGNLTSGQSCTYSVTFTPTAPGLRTGTMTINYDSGAESVVVNLTGTGTGLQIAPASGGSTSATVSSGQPATYSLTIAPQNGFTGMVSFSCTGLPQNASCSINPNSATFGTTPANVTVTIATQQSTTGVVMPVTSAPSISGGKPVVIAAFTALVAMMMAGYLWMASLVGRKLRMVRVMGTVVMTALAVVGLAALVSCGGGSGGGGSTSKTPAGTYTVNFVATSGGGTATQALTLTVK